jgi:hypothetical protein
VTFPENHVTFPENLVTFHKLLQPTIAVGHDGSPSGGQTMECHKQNDEPNNLQATMSPTLLSAPTVVLRRLGEWNATFDGSDRDSQFIPAILLKLLSGPTVVN